ncbi:MAG: thiamine-phosphate kinase [Alphaproteobacteria bacterium]
MPVRSEFDLIASLFAPMAAGYGGAFGLLDDAALLEIPAGDKPVVTTDTMVAGVHFLPEDPPDLIARKLIRVNLSDIAAMGARPWVFLLNACLPGNVTASWLEAFASGLDADRTRYGLHLIGGDTVATEGPAVLGLTAFGLTAEGRILRRSGAGVGDLVCVTGTVGDGALGLLAARGEFSGFEPAHVQALAGRYRLPEPRVTLGPHLPGLASAGMDISDGLCQDLGHICRASGVGAEVHSDSLPLSAAARAVCLERPELMETVLCGGDDYELLFALPPDRIDRLMTLAAAAGVSATVIGRIIEGEGVRVVGLDGRPLVLGRSGYRHF